MIRAAFALFLLLIAVVCGLADDWQLADLCCAMAAILAAWSAIRPSYRPESASVMRRLA